MSGNIDKVFDEAVNTLIAQACSETEDRIFDEYEKKAKEKDIIFSDDHNKIMRQIFDNEKSMLQKSKQRKIIKHILIAAIILMTLILALAITVTAFREKLIGFSLDITDKNTEIAFEKEEAIFFEKTNMDIAYIPNGFEEEKRYMAEGYVYAKYSAGDKFFTAEKEIVPDKLIIDTENADIGETYINGNKAVVSSSDKQIIIVWSKGDHTYTVSGNIEMEELTEIAKNIS